MKKTQCSLLSVAAMYLCSAHAFAAPVETIVPSGNGTWTYDTAKPAPKPGEFVQNITIYNGMAPGHEITQVFYYGGDIEMYCRGSGDSDPSTPCNAENLFSYYNPDNQSGALYGQVPGVKNLIPVIDGRVDSPAGSDYLDHLNDMSENDAVFFADMVAKQVCADDRIDGIQFDIEPFSFTGGSGAPYAGKGQQYFYTEIAKDFAGWNGQQDQAGVNTYDPQHADPLSCVSKNHPNGRIFSVFTFSKNVTPDVVAVFNYHHNGYIVDSLYDLGAKPGGSLNTPDEFTQLITAETKAMSQLGIPYQFAIPGAGSAHEYESAIDPKGHNVKGFSQVQYINAALTVIAPYRTDPNFKGIALWSWNPLDHMNWNGWKIFPGNPTPEVLDVLKTGL